MKSRLIAGIDPGLAKTGVGIIKQTGTKLEYVSHALLTTKNKYDTHQRLHSLFLQAQDFFKDYEVNMMIVEELFVGINRNTIIKLSMARSMMLLLGSMMESEIVHVPTRLVKQKITGNGGATKEEVSKTVCESLKINLDQHDCTDALACAIYANHLI